MALLSGCASPGPPQPPSLKLPEAISEVTASRVGNEVRLQWTTPSRTTDKLSIVGPVQAEICREIAVATAASVRVGQNAAKGTVTAPCSPVVLRVQVKPGASEAVDGLPAELTSAPARILAYRVQLRNAAGRTAGPSAVVFAASGPAPHAVEELHGTATKDGVVLEWKAETQGTGNGAQGTEGAETVDLDRFIVEPAKTTAAATSTTAATTADLKPEHKSALLAATTEPTELRFRAGAAGSGTVDTGGMIDRTAQIGHAYRYTAQRVRSVELAGQRLEVRSLPSSVVTVEMKDVFPPEAPVGLVAVPGFAVTANDLTQKPTIDLSWEPNMEPHIAGYRVYRHDFSGETADAWQQLNSLAVSVAAYRDLSVVAGRKYGYRVTAVDTAGNESKQSNEVLETAPAQ